MISILILTKNEEQDLPACLQSVSWSDDIHVLDSFSNDRTIEIAQSFNATITQRKFDNWSTHQNWALKNIKFKHPWVLYLDADERVSLQLKEELLVFDTTISDIAAYEIRRKDYAWNGKWLKYSQVSPYYLRLFQPGKIRYERLVNPVSIPEGPVKRLNGSLHHYPFSKGFTYWFQRHLGYAEMEAKTRINDISNNVNFSLKKALFSKDFTEKRFHQKGLFYKMYGRPLIKWSYMMFWRKGFLDGITGLRYATMQAIYEYFIIIKTRELQKTGSSAKIVTTNARFANSNAKEIITIAEETSITRKKVAHNF
jgi:glycosyltransferase involved in cell wall biosynthesis